MYYTTYTTYYYYSYGPRLPLVLPTPIRTGQRDDTSDEEVKEAWNSDPARLHGDFVPPPMREVEKTFKDKEFIDSVTQIVGKAKKDVEKYLKKNTHIVAWTDTGEIDPSCADTIMECARELKTETLDLRCFVQNSGSDSMYLRFFPHLHYLSKLKKIILGRPLTQEEANEQKKNLKPYEFVPFASFTKEQLSKHEAILNRVAFILRRSPEAITNTKMFPPTESLRTFYFTPQTGCFRLGNVAFITLNDLSKVLKCKKWDLRVCHFIESADLQGHIEDIPTHITKLILDRELYNYEAITLQRLKHSLLVKTIPGAVDLNKELALIRQKETAFKVPKPTPITLASGATPGVSAEGYVPISLGQVSRKPLPIPPKRGELPLVGPSWPTVTPYPVPAAARTGRLEPSASVDGDEEGLEAK